LDKKCYIDYEDEDAYVTVMQGCALNILKSNLYNYIDLNLSLYFKKNSLTFIDSNLYNWIRF